MNADVILEAYCVESITRSHHALNTVHSEARIMAILVLINDQRMKNRVLLEIMKRTNVPWSYELGQLMKEVRYIS